MPRLTDFACCNLYIKTVQSSPRVRRDSLHLVFLMYFIFVFKKLKYVILLFIFHTLSFTKKLCIAQVPMLV